ncbi:hypothetical protein RBB78_08435 [Tunturiibacter empetritectus]
MGKIQQAGLLGSLDYLRLEVVSSLKELTLDAVSYGAETDDQQGKGDQDQYCRDVSGSYGKSVERWSEEVIEAQAREDDRQHSRSHSGMPCGESNRKE